MLAERCRWAEQPQPTAGDGEGLQVGHPHGGETHGVKRGSGFLLPWGTVSFLHSGHPDPFLDTEQGFGLSTLPSGAKEMFTLFCKRSGI